jgi:dodecin
MQYPALAAGRHLLARRPVARRDSESQASNVEERTVVMADGVYRVTEVIGVSSESWEAAARSAVETAAKTVRDLRIAEVIRQDVAIENGTIKHYRVRLAISFKYETSD